MFKRPEEERRIRFKRIRLKQWNKLTLWRYLAILVIVILLLKFLHSLASSP